jgi:hypothetical protein
MNLERLLAENMIRFNTKNLNENQIRKLLTEQLSVSGTPTSGVPVVNQFVNDSSLWGPKFTAAVNTTKALLTRNAVPVSAGVDLAAAWIMMYNSRPDGVDKMFKSIENLKNYIEGFDPSAPSFKAIEIQLNENPDVKGKVLTSGVITATSKTGEQPGEASDINDIVQFCNDYNLNGIAKGITTAGIDIDNIIIAPGKYYDNPAVSPSGKTGFYGDSFVGGRPGTDKFATPGAGSLIINGGYSDACVYSLTQYVAAAAKSVGKQITTITVEPGPVVPINASDAFEVLKTQLTATGTEDITTAVTGLSKIGKITNVSIESGASFDEPVKLDNAGFAKAVGLQPNQVPADPTKDAEGEVKDPMSGGNAFLAYMRAEALKTLLTKLIPGVAPTVTAKVAKGGAAARYVKLNITVQKPDGTTAVTSDDLNTQGIGSKTIAGAGMFKMYRYDV